MRLFHGTSEKHLEDILENGLRPRGAGDGVWEDFPSRPDLVYLTDAYAGYFAAAGAEDGEKWVVLEIDPDYLDHEDFLPDEDFIEQAHRGAKKADLPEWFGDDLKERHRYIWENLESWSHAWKDSLEHMGNVAYAGEIPPEAIVRYGVFDPKSASGLAGAMLDPSVSIMNYRFVGAKYKAMTRWFVGDDVLPIEMVGFPTPGPEMDRWVEHVENAKVEVTELH